MCLLITLLKMKSKSVRENMVEECLNVEKVYTENLDDLVKFKGPLRAESICSETEIQDLFVNFDQVF